MRLWVLEPQLKCRSLRVDCLSSGCGNASCEPPCQLPPRSGECCEGNSNTVVTSFKLSVVVYFLCFWAQLDLSFIELFFFFCLSITNYRLPLVATSACFPAWSHLRSRAPRAATWANTPRALVAIMQTPTLSGSAFFKQSRLLPAARVAIQHPGHIGISSALRSDAHTV